MTLERFQAWRDGAAIARTFSLDANDDDARARCVSQDVSVTTCAMVSARVRGGGGVVNRSRL